MGEATQHNKVICFNPLDWRLSYTAVQPEQLQGNLNKLGYDTLLEITRSLLAPNQLQQTSTKSLSDLKDRVEQLDQRHQRNLNAHSRPVKWLIKLWERVRNTWNHGRFETHGTFARRIASRIHTNAWKKQVTGKIRKTHTSVSSIKIPDEVSTREISRMQEQLDRLSAMRTDVAQFGDGISRNSALTAEDREILMAGVAQSTYEVDQLSIEIDRCLQQLTDAAGPDLQQRLDRWKERQQAQTLKPSDIDAIQQDLQLAKQYAKLFADRPGHEAVEQFVSEFEAFADQVEKRRHQIFRTDFQHQVDAISAQFDQLERLSKSDQADESGAIAALQSLIDALRTEAQRVERLEKAVAQSPDLKRADTRRLNQQVADLKRKWTSDLQPRIREAAEQLAAAQLALVTGRSSHLDHYIRKAGDVVDRQIQAMQQAESLTVPSFPLPTTQQLEHDLGLARMLFDSDPGILQPTGRHKQLLKQLSAATEALKAAEAQMHHHLETVQNIEQLATTVEFSFPEGLQQWDHDISQALQPTVEAAVQLEVLIRRASSGSMPDWLKRRVAYTKGQATGKIDMIRKAHLINCRLFLAHAQSCAASLQKDHRSAPKNSPAARNIAAQVQFLLSQLDPFLQLFGQLRDDAWAPTAIQQTLEQTRAILSPISEAAPAYWAAPESLPPISSHISDDTVPLPVREMQRTIFDCVYGPTSGRDSQLTPQEARRLVQWHTGRTDAEMAAWDYADHTTQENDIGHAGAQLASPGGLVFLESLLKDRLGVDSHVVDQAMDLFKCEIMAAPIPRLERAGGTHNPASLCYMNATHQMLRTLPGFLPALKMRAARTSENSLENQLLHIMETLNAGQECTEQMITRYFQRCWHSGWWPSLETQLRYPHLPPSQVGLGIQEDASEYREKLLAHLGITNAPLLTRRTRSYFDDAAADSITFQRDWGVNDFLPDLKEVREAAKQVELLRQVSPDMSDMDIEHTLVLQHNLSAHNVKAALLLLTRGLQAKRISVQDLKLTPEEHILISSRDQYPGSEQASGDPVPASAVTRAPDHIGQSYVQDIKRFVRPADPSVAPRKVMHEIELNPEMTLADAEGEHRMRARSIIIHSGSSIRSGHYYNLIRHDDGTWWQYNNSSVTPVPGNNINIATYRQNAVTIVWERVDES